MKYPPSHVNEDSFCDGCGMDPIVGNMYTCSTCPNYSLCETCYQTGLHGYEDSELLKNVREDFALRNIVDKCKNRVPEKVFEVLMKKVCKGQVDKFNFMAKWISGLVLDHPLHELSVRGIEIPHLDIESRTTLVELLTPVLAERTDLEVCMEWFSPVSFLFADAIICRTRNSFVSLHVSFRKRRMNSHRVRSVNWRRSAFGSRRTRTPSRRLPRTRRIRSRRTTPSRTCRRPV
jgi:hypothetical protein